MNKFALVSCEHQASSFEQPEDCSSLLTRRSRLQELASRLTEVRTLANFVRTFELNSNISSHDWHVQPSCQRPKSLPPERSASVRKKPTRTSLSPPHIEFFRPRNLSKISFCPRKCQPGDFTGFSQRAASCKQIRLARRPRLKARSFRAAKRIFPPAPVPNFGTSRDGR